MSNLRSKKSIQFETLKPSKYDIKQANSIRREDDQKLQTQLENIF